MGVVRYYDEPGLDDTKVSYDENKAAMARVSKELFDDLVSIGAVKLPPGYVPADVDFIMKAWHVTKTSPGVMRLVLCDCKTGAEYEASGVYGALNYETTLGSPLVGNLVHDLAAAAWRLARR